MTSQEVSVLYNPPAISRKVLQLYGAVFQKRFDGVQEAHNSNVERVQVREKYNQCWRPCSFLWSTVSVP